MCSFLKGQILWCIVTSEISKLTQKKDEDEENFTKRLGMWDGKNHHILNWLRNNTCANIIKLNFCRFDTVKEV